MSVGQSATKFKSRLLTIVCLCSTHMMCMIVPNACNTLRIGCIMHTMHDAIFFIFFYFEGIPRDTNFGKKISKLTFWCSQSPPNHISNAFYPFIDNCTLSLFANFHQFVLNPFDEVPKIKLSMYDTLIDCRCTTRRIDEKFLQSQCSS